MLHICYTMTYICIYIYIYIYIDVHIYIYVLLPGQHQLRRLEAADFLRQGLRDELDLTLVM